MGLALLVACGVGVRPRLVEPNAVGGQPGTPTGVDAVDAVLHLLEGDQAPQLTAGDTISGGYTFESRIEDGPGRNPQQRTASAHAACFSMALSSLLAQRI